MGNGAATGASGSVIWGSIGNIEKSGPPPPSIPPPKQALSGPDKTLSFRRVPTTGCTVSSRTVPVRTSTQPAMSLSPALRPWFAVRLLLRALICLCPVVAAEAQGLVAHYPFSGNANDESGNGHHGVVTGATLIADRFGQARSAYLFDGKDFITVPHSPEFSFRPDQEFTIAAWV